MTKSAVITLRLTPELRDRLSALARDEKRSLSQVAADAIAAYVDFDAWQVSHIKAALVEDERDGLGVPHDEVVRWMESWGTDHELPPPVPRK